MHRTAIIALALTAAATAGAQRAHGRFLVQTNPAGVISYGPSLEFVANPAPHVSAAAGLRIFSFGLIPQLGAAADDDNLHFSWMVSGSAYYHVKPGFDGWFFGPRIEVGQGSTPSYDDQYTAGAAEVGYRWVTGRAFAFSVGGWLGVVADRYTHVTNTFDRGTDYYPFLGVAVNLGWVFGARP